MITIDSETVLEKVEAALINKRQQAERDGQPVPKKISPQEWLRQNLEDLKDEVESQIKHAIWHMLMTSEERMVSKPVLEFKREHGGTIRLYVYRAGQCCYVGDHRQFHFGHDGTAGLVYDEQSRASGHQATDVDVDNTGTWKWIQEWMTKGMQAEGILPKEANEG